MVHKILRVAFLVVFYPILAVYYTPYFAMAAAITLSFVGGFLYAGFKILETVFLALG